MRKIVQLEQHVANLIAAGEVVSRPASVVKELVENSIDAGADNITIEITGGGIQSIRITDNGCGIYPDDIKTAFLRHATSKLNNENDLGAIGTLGFRGEALASIAAVSHVEIISRTSDNTEGVRFCIDGGEGADASPVGSPVGTSICVRDLFYNTPARQKFMKTDRAEGAAVTSTVQSLALSRPDISFKYIKDGKTEYHTPGDSKADSCVYNILGKEFMSGLIFIEHNVSNISVEGYISDPGFSQGNRRHQFFVLNGRIIQSAVLRSALEQAYRNFLMVGRFPACVLYISLDVSTVDVNVHPTKSEVKFLSDKQIFDAVYYAVLGALDKPVVTSQEQNFEKPSITQGLPRNYDTSPVNNNISFYRERHENRDNQISLSVSEASPQYIGSVFPDYRIVGEVLNSYIIVEYNDSVWFVDKHAAHERICYDALSCGEYEPMSETLLTPIICNMGADEVNLLIENDKLLERFGFEIDSFGETSIAVRCVPSDIGIDDITSTLSDIAAELEYGVTPRPEKLDAIYKTIACKAAIKAGSVSDIRELELLVKRVISGSITHCPHGRPVAFELSKTALEKSFGRI